jgi:iron complex outermembrane recepter protein
MFVKASKPSRWRTSAAALSIAAALLSAPAAWAAEPRQNFDMPQKSTALALNDFARQTGVQILYDFAEAKRTTAPALKGSYTRDEALALLLANTRFVVTARTDSAIFLKVSERQGETAATPDPEPVVITGTRIRGREPASPVTRVTQAQMQLGGQSDLGQMARALPQNFGGGVNPGIALGTPDLRNVNINAASSFNLRGLGPDATLTLLNGNRLAYDAIGQAVDVSAIPLAVVDRVEIVTDGASALYGSDAVGGVVNILLKRDFDGVEISGRYRGATGGAATESGVSVVAGRTWIGGGFIAAMDVSHHGGLQAHDRKFTRALDGGTTLIPEQEAGVLLLSGHHRLTDRLKLSVDALASERTSVFTKPYDAGVTYLENGSRETPRLQSYSISPRLTLDLGGNWQGYWSATAGEDKTVLETTAYYAGERSASYPGYYVNQTLVTEIGAEGRVFSTPAGAARLAVGGGYRKIRLDGYLAFEYASGFSLVATDFDRSREATYGFVELSVPLVAPEQGITGFYRLSLTSALRHEAYSGLAAMTTPKLGVIYQPIQALDLKLSWGKSFKVPTLYQTYRGSLPYLFDASLISETAPAGTTFLNLDGGNEDLKAETATALVASLAYRFDVPESAGIGLSYFDIDYTDRVLQPIVSMSGALDNPAYAGSVYLNPTPEQLSAAIGDLGRLRNYSSGAYDPASVIGIVDNREQNVYRQAIRGFDFTGYYARTAGPGILRFEGSASYLETRQRLNATNAELALAGTIFNPPHWRGRFSATWEGQAVTIAGFANHVGALDDARFGTQVTIPAQTTFDATLRVRLGHGLGESGATVTVSVLNLFDEAPETVRTAAAYYVPYDATNHSATGRVLGMTISKRW